MTYPNQNQNFPQYPGQPQFPQQGGYNPTPQFSHYQEPQQSPQPSLVQGSLDAFFQQPSVGGGPSLKFEVNTTHVGFIARTITNADIQQQTQPNSNTPATFKDGSPKFVMKVPLIVQPNNDYPDGQAQWYCSGAARDDLVRAMAEAGAPSGPPEKGALVTITCTGTRKSGPGMNPAKLYKIVYKRPDIQEPVEVAQEAPRLTAVPSTGSPEPVDGLDPDQQALMSRLVGAAA